MNMKNKLTPTTISPMLVNDIKNLFDIPDQFLGEYQKQQPALDWQKNSWESFYQTLSPTNKMYVSYALSTVVRGRDFYSLLDNLGCIHVKNRYLDIGTAYAGYLRAFKEQGFHEVVGIEVQEHLAKLGTANIDGLKNARLIVSDFLHEDTSSLGMFDLISCNDVIEHVADAALALEKMSHMVKKGGYLILAVPNKDSVSNVKSDGHFNLFGITQLHRDTAANYYAAISELDSPSAGFAFRKSKIDEYKFEMGEMYHLDWYTAHLSRHNLRVEIADINKIGRIKDAQALLSDLKDVYRHWRDTIAPKLDQELAHQMGTAIDNYINQFTSDLLLISDENSQEYFENKYLISCWYLIAGSEKPISSKFKIANILRFFKHNIFCRTNK